MLIADSEFWNQILIWFLGLVGTIITTVLAPYVIKLLQSKTDNENLKYVIDELVQTVATSVDHVNQTFVNQLKSDGKFDAEKQKEALEKAVTETMNNLTKKTITILGKDGIDVEQLIIKYVEAAIAQNKV